MENKQPVRTVKGTNMKSISHTSKNVGAFGGVDSYFTPPIFLQAPSWNSPGIES